MGAMEVYVGRAGTVKAVRKLVFRWIRKDESGLRIAGAALVATEVGLPGQAVRDGTMVDLMGSGSASRLVKNTLSVLLIDTVSKTTAPLPRFMLICVSKRSFLSSSPSPYGLSRRD